MKVSDLVVGQYWQYKNSKAHSNFIFYVKNVNYESNIANCLIISGINRSHVTMTIAKHILTLEENAIFCLTGYDIYDPEYYTYLGNNKAIIEALYG